MKSHEEDLLLVCESVLMDASAKCTTVNLASIKRDLLTIKSRVEDEGVSFLTITLPNFGKDFELSLAEGRISRHAFCGFKRRGRLPVFLRGFVQSIFDVATGGLLDVPDITAIEGVRQIAYTFKKVAMPCTLKRVEQALSDYEEIECSIRYAMPSGDAYLFSKISDLLWGNVFVGSYDPTFPLPKHGPGQTESRISGNRKYAVSTWHERLEPFFPADWHLMSCYSQLDDARCGITSIDFVPEERESPVRVVAVPKTLKGPRIIAIEPVCTQYTQQALAEYVIQQLETHELTRGHINFSDQGTNRELAMAASKSGNLATLDLSSASDRVPLSLVSLMLASKRDLLDAILACRSRSARLPSGKVIPLMKFASMGSALCFPVQAMYYFTIIVMARMKKHNLPVTLRNIKAVSREVYVYGDDLIVPTHEVEVVVEALTSFHCKVNSAKSFWSGKFRESCGMDAYDGCDVTPTYLRHMRPNNEGDAQALVSLVATSNHFYRRGYMTVASLLQKWVEQLLGPLPIVLETSPGLGWIRPEVGVTTDRWNKKLQRPEIRTWIVSPVYKEDPLDGWYALLKCLLLMERRNGDSFLYPKPVDKKHLERSPRSGTVALKRRRTTAY